MEVLNSGEDYILRATDAAGAKNLRVRRDQPEERPGSGRRLRGAHRQDPRAGDGACSGRGARRHACSRLGSQGSLMRRFGSLVALGLAGCLHGPVGPTWYGRGPNTSPPSEPLRAPAATAQVLLASEESCRAILEEASALGYEPATSGQPCLRTRDKATPFFLALERESEGGVRRELTFAWRAGGVEGSAYIPAFPAQRDEAQRQLKAIAAEWSESLTRAADRRRAPAQDQRIAEAAAHFDRAVGHFKAGQWEAAASEFEAAYTAQPRWEVLYNIAVAQQKLGRNALARSNLERYLAEGGARVAPKRRADVEKALAETQSQLGRVNLQIVGQASDIQVDGRSLGASPPPVLWLEPGRHEFRALQGGKTGAGIAVGVAAGDTAAVLLEIPAP
ncbi:MAG: hypothetical protein QM765_41380 [Myxococcales bacterium]